MLNSRKTCTSTAISCNNIFLTWIMTLIIHISPSPTSNFSSFGFTLAEKQEELRLEAEYERVIGIKIDDIKGLLGEGIFRPLDSDTQFGAIILPETSHVAFHVSGSRSPFTSSTTS
jgi:hypothetical protein